MWLHVHRDIEIAGAATVSAGVSLFRDPQPAPSMIPAGTGRPDGFSAHATALAVADRATLAGLPALAVARRTRSW